MRHTVRQRRCPQASVEAVADAVAVDDTFAVGCPGHHDVVRPHAVAHIVARIGSGVGQTPGFASVGGNNINLAVAVILAGESNGFAVGRETRKDFIAHVRCQPSGLTACNGCCVEVAGVGEYDVRAVCGGEAEQPCFVAVGFGSRRRAEGEQGEKELLLHVASVFF